MAGTDPILEQMRAEDKLITHSYHCIEHGIFKADVSKTFGDCFEQPCPKCRRVCEFYRPPVEKGLPFIWGDIRPSRAYWSDDKGIMVTRKQDLRDWYKQTGNIPLSDKDIENAVDAVQVADRQGAEELKWYDRECEKEAAAIRKQGGNVDSDDTDWEP